MNPMLTLRTYDEYRDAIKGSGALLFRGQAKDYPGLIPSAFRLQPFLDTATFLDPAKRLYFLAHRIDEVASEVHELDEESFSKWVRLNERRPIEDGTLEWFDRLFDWLFRTEAPQDEGSESEAGWPFGFDIMRPPLGHGMGTSAGYSEHVGLQCSYEIGNHYHFALLQHYGAPSPVLDLAYDPCIALWFATHQLKVDKTTGTAWYEPSQAPGVVYTIATQSDRVIDLREGKEVPIAGLRGQRQQGGLLIGATQHAPDLVDNITSRIFVHPETFNPFHPELAMLSQAYLFPPAEEDQFYRVLLAAKTSADRGIQSLARYILDYRTIPVTSSGPRAEPGVA